MRRSLFWLTGLVAVCIGIPGVSRPASAQFTANMLFDGTFDSTLTPPFIGSGTLSLAAFPGFGTFGWDAINPTISINVAGNLFTNASITSNNALTTLVFEDLGPVPGGEQVGVYFDDTGSGAGGPEGGALDLQAGNGDYLTFQPSYAGGTPKDLYISSLTEGTYGIDGTLPTGTPEPGGIALFAGAAVGFGAFIRTRKIGRPQSKE